MSCSGKPATAPSVSTWRTPFSTAGMNWPGNRSAHHFVDELETLAALERLDAQEHLAELPRAAGLLLVPAVPFRLARDGLAIGNARRVRLHAHAVALRHALEQHAQVELAHAVQHGLIERGVMLEAHARIFRGELVKRVRQPLLIAAPLGLDGHAQHRRREVDGLAGDTDPRRASRAARRRNAARPLSTRRRCRREWPCGTSTGLLAEDA